MQKVNETDQQSLAWRPMSTAPKNATWIEVRLHGHAYKAHYAEDLSGSDQPAFLGWFIEGKDSTGKVTHFQEIETPDAWRPLAVVAPQRT